MPGGHTGAGGAAGAGCGCCWSHCNNTPVWRLLAALPGPSAACSAAPASALARPAGRPGPGCCCWPPLIRAVSSSLIKRREQRCNAQRQCACATSHVTASCTCWGKGMPRPRAAVGPAHLPLLPHLTWLLWLQKWVQHCNRYTQVPHGHSACSTQTSSPVRCCSLHVPSQPREQPLAVAQVAAPKQVVVIELVVQGVQIRALLKARLPGDERVVAAPERRPKAGAPAGARWEAGPDNSSSTATGARWHSSCQQACRQLLLCTPTRACHDALTSCPIPPRGGRSTWLDRRCRAAHPPPQCCRSTGRLHARVQAGHALKQQPCTLRCTSSATYTRGLVTLRHGHKPLTVSHSPCSTLGLTCTPSNSDSMAPGCSSGSASWFSRLLPASLSWCRRRCSRKKVTQSSVQGLGCCMMYGPGTG